MGQVSTVGLDLAKNVFQVHGIDDAGLVVLRRKVQRGELEAFFAALPPCTVGVEACSTAHHRARVLAGLGHRVRLMPPAYVKPYIKRVVSRARHHNPACLMMRCAAAVAMNVRSCRADGTTGCGRTGRRQDGRGCARRPTALARSRGAWAAGLARVAGDVGREAEGGDAAAEGRVVEGAVGGEHPGPGVVRHAQGGQRLAGRRQVVAVAARYGE
jgi:transposase